MKRLLLLIGFLPLLLPLQAGAQALSPLCQQVDGVPPVSPYTQKVLERSDAGIAYALSIDENGGEFETLPAVARTLAGFFRMLVDIRLTVTEHAEDLAQNTACKHADVLKIQCQMEKVNNEIEFAFRNAKPARLELLQAQLPFLRERLEHLNRGGEDPSFADPTWGQINDIDPPTGDYWCCGNSGETCSQTSACAGDRFYSLDGCLRASQCSAPVGESAEESRMCPFTSDYGPALKNGYGCDVSVMGPRAAYGTMLYERDTLQYLMNQLNRVSSNLGGTQSLPAPHKTVDGCLRKYGYCTEDRTVGCSEDVDCVEANAGACAFDLPEDASWSGVRSPFSLLKDQFAIIGKFLALRAQQGYSRMQSAQLKNTDEFTESESAEQEEQQNEGGIGAMFRGGFRLDFSNWSRIQGREDVSPFIQSTDAQQAMAAALPFSGIGKDLQKVVTDMDGIRGFLLQYAYFARRTCLNRPCSLKLEQIMRMASTNACFPFATGDYKKDDEADPQWKKCAEDACVPLEGMTIDPAKCVCYKIEKGPDLEYGVSEVDTADSPDVCVPR